MSTIDSYRAALAQDPQDLRALLGLATVLGEAGDYQGAAEACSLVVALDPQCVGGWAVYGGVLARMGDYPAALAALDRALQLGPGCPAAHWNRSGVRLVLGDFAGGWADYEWGKVNRMRRVRTLQPEWTGAPLPGGTLLLWCEQGAGDTFQFVRLVQRAKEQAQAARVLLEVPEALVPLLHGQVDATVYAQTPAGDLPYRFDHHTSLLSLPHLLGLTLESIPAAPYLGAKGKANLAGDGRKVGIVWRGNPEHANDANRSITDLSGLSPLWQVPGVQFYSLGIDVECPAGVVDLGAGITDWTHTAALLNELDLLVTVDTGIAHLAGAMGRPTWLMLPYAPDWRWLLERADSPWYPSTRLFRQETAGDWKSVVQRVAAELGAL
jgi:hypothetical protein